MGWTLYSSQAMFRRVDGVIRGFEYMIYAARERAVAAILAASLLAIGDASAETIYSIKVTGVGNQAGQLYANLASTPPGCSGAIVYHSSETQAGQYVMSILLAARLANSPIARIDYTVRSGGFCWIDLVQL